MEYYDVAEHQRLNSSKDIIVVDEIDDHTYETAKSVCENICGRLYFPSTLKDNFEVYSILDRVNGRYKSGYIWLRMTYNETVETWYDPDNKEDLTFLKFHPNDKIYDCTGKWYCEEGGAKEHHAVMDNNGKWWSREGDKKYSEYVFCELT